MQKYLYPNPAPGEIVKFARGSSTSTANFFSAIGRRGGARGSNDPVPVEDDANDSLDELMQEIDRQMVDDSTHPEQRAEVPDPVVD